MADREHLHDDLVQLEIAAAFLAGEIASEIAERGEPGGGTGPAAGSPERQDAPSAPNAAAVPAPVGDPRAAAAGRRYALAA